MHSYTNNFYIPSTQFEQELVYSKTIFIIVIFFFFSIFTHKMYWATSFSYGELLLAPCVYLYIPNELVYILHSLLLFF